jgi:6,7-dimethyl-8-ribityllumazine synthase
MIYESVLDGTNYKIAIALARFNSLVTEQLLNGCLDGLKRHGVADKNIDVIKVPGSFELPLTASKLAATKQYDAIITLGSIIRGETYHYNVVCNETAKGVANVSLSSGIPIIFGVLTTDTLEQAQQRSGGKYGNKGFDAAVSAIEMIGAIKHISKV